MRDDFLFVQYVWVYSRKFHSYFLILQYKNMNERFLMDRSAEVCITAIDSTGKLGVVYKEFQKTLFTFLEK